ncbi:penicillin acylase family protein [Sphingomonas sp.]|uniref:penicillin acylase family protein n=1 Tax=Sphingomonas sp. TaxID=28214 RepID=UPI002C02B4D7|nr:penicillin acylase family protein [Sphingomonas sp.]HTG37302.1 penicillin acylase family protein [Sphingomonas sp.]
MTDARLPLKITRRALLLGGVAMAATPLRAQDVPFVSIQPSAPPVPPPLPRRVRLKGLSAAIEIVDDRWGVPHIRAATKADAFFGQGWVVARDRLFQIDYDYRRRMGRLAEAFGADFVDSDIRAALARFRGDVDGELRAVPDEVRACAEAYVAGINARIEQVSADPALLPAEHAILGLKPLRWSLADLVAARELVAGNVGDEVRRARLSAMKRLDLDALIAPPRPDHAIRFPDGLDIEAVTAADLGLLAPRTPEADGSPDGSNAWTVAPSRTATGRPILANDPHLSIGGFAPRHVAHLSAPGLDVIGGGAPGLPGIMQGHTDRFAFGRTNGHIDQSDLYVLELNPVDPERYWHRARWKTFDRQDVTIRVRGEEPRKRVLRHAVQGPVIAHDPKTRRASALANIAQQPGASGIFAMIAINLARDWAGLRAAFRHHPSPANFHYADVDGHIAWSIIGFAPRRRGGHDGMVPAPGDGRYDWEGRLSLDQMPSITDPESGWMASANQNNLPADYKPTLSHDFSEPWRYDRITAVLKNQTRHSVADSAALMQDLSSAPARRFVAMLPADPAPAAREAVEMLRGWDGTMAADSGPAALFALSWADLEQRLLNIVVPLDARDMASHLETGVMLAILEQPDKRLGPNPTGSRDLIVAMALIAGWAEAVRRMGPEPALWRWGTIHDVRVEHPLAARFPAIAAAFPAIEAGGSGGNRHTVNARWVASDMGVSGGASYLQAIDVGGWDDSLFLNFPGQSGDPASPHYRDQVQPWIEGRMLPLIFSRERVDTEATARTILDPR